MTNPAAIIFRPLETREECRACVRLQKEIWGKDFLDVVPPTILMVNQRVGGVTAGAFDTNQRLLGFVFGISGVTNGLLSHWSDMLAVRPEARGIGLGKRLKLYQRELLLQKGVQVVYWSFDPLVARNAHLNINGLGAKPMEYVVNMYEDTGSKLHKGLETDRLVVEWPLADPRVERIISGLTEHLPSGALDAPVINPNALTTDTPHAQAFLSPRTNWVQITVPPNIEEIKTSAPDDARLWQLATRRAFQSCLTEGYSVVGFRCATDLQYGRYLLNKTSD